jgi:hypothetical protein
MRGSRQGLGGLGAKFAGSGLGGHAGKGMWLASKPSRRGRVRGSHGDSGWLPDTPSAKNAAWWHGKATTNLLALVKLSLLLDAVQDGLVKASLELGRISSQLVDLVGVAKRASE